MTFVLNVLHKDFSLLVSDKRAKAEGPTTITMPGITIHAKKGATINGVNKTLLNKNASVALGYAGTTQDHFYASRYEESDTPDEALKIVREHMEKFLRVEDRASVLALETFMENQGICTFFDAAHEAYFSTIYLFSPIHSYNRMYARTVNGARLIHVGSGSNAFDQAVGSEKINQFAGSVNGIGDLERCLDWIRNAFQKVSEVDEASGPDIVAKVSTRSQPTFVPACDG